MANACVLLPSHLPTCMCVFKSNYVYMQLVPGYGCVHTTWTHTHLHVPVYQRAHTYTHTSRSTYIHTHSWVCLRARKRTHLFAYYQLIDDVCWQLVAPSKEPITPYISKVSFLAWLSPSSAPTCMFFYVCVYVCIFVFVGTYTQTFAFGQQVGGAASFAACTHVHECVRSCGHVPICCRYMSVYIHPNQHTASPNHSMTHNTHIYIHTWVCTYTQINIPHRQIIPWHTTHTYTYIQSAYIHLNRPYRIVEIVSATSIKCRSKKIYQYVLLQLVTSTKDLLYVCVHL